MPKVTVITGPAAGQSLELESAVVVGRDGDLAISDQDLSRRHARLSPTAQGIVIEDLGSTNGTYVDGRRITEPVTVSHDAKIAIGGSELQLEQPLIALDSTRVSAKPVIDVDQATVARGTMAPGPAEEPAPAAEPAPVADEPAPAAPEPRPKKRLVVLLLALLAVAAVAGVLIVVLSGDDDDSTTVSHALDAKVSAIPLTAAAAQAPTTGELDGDPLGRVGVVVQREPGVTAEPGGPPVKISGTLFVTAPAGAMALNFDGTLQVADSGAETLDAKGTATNGTLKYEDLEGTFTLTGGRAAAADATASYTLKGNLNY